MYHQRFRGSHYEIGLQWGALLARHGNYILEHLGFPITPERLRFAEACFPIYQTYFPEILAEIQGIADGQNCRADMLQAFLFSMYAMPPSCCCSCFAVADGEQILLGRNSDFLTSLEKTNQNVIYRFSGPSYAFTGNTTAFVQMEDGVNACGLAVGLTSVYPWAIRPGMNAGLLLRFFLEKCGSTREVIRQAQLIPISSAQTFTVADSNGDIAVLECDCGHLEIIQPARTAPYVCAANLFTSPGMAGLNIPDIDDWMAGSRYQTMDRMLKHRASGIALDDAVSLLSGKEGFLCQYDRKTGKDTVWSVIYDLKNRQIWRTEGNPGRRAFKADTRFHF